MLLEYYNKQQKKLFKCSIAAWAFLTLLMTWLGDFLSARIPNAFAQGVLEWVLALAAPTTIVVFFYFHILKLVDTKWWKQKYPEYDISGEWQDTTTYTKSLDGNGWEDIQVVGDSTVIFEQTCRQIKIPPSDGEGFVWQSILVDWDNRGELHILYEVRYKDPMQQKGHPESRTGYERMHIDRTGLSVKQRPHTMCGQFWHCIKSDGKPMRLGDVVYKRTTT